MGFHMAFWCSKRLDVSLGEAANGRPSRTTQELGKDLLVDICVGHRLLSLQPSVWQGHSGSGRPWGMLGISFGVIHGFSVRHESLAVHPDVIFNRFLLYLMNRRWLQRDSRKKCSCVAMGWNVDPLQEAERKEKRKQKAARLLMAGQPLSEEDEEQFEGLTPKASCSFNLLAYDNAEQRDAAKQSAIENIRLSRDCCTQSEDWHFWDHYILGHRFASPVNLLKTEILYDSLRLVQVSYAGNTGLRRQMFRQVQIFWPVWGTTPCLWPSSRI